MPSSRESSLSRNQARITHIAGSLFTELSGKPNQRHKILLKYPPQLLKLFCMGFSSDQKVHWHLLCLHTFLLDIEIVTITGSNADRVVCFFSQAASVIAKWPLHISAWKTWRWSRFCSIYLMTRWAEVCLSNNEHFVDCHYNYKESFST